MTMFDCIVSALNRNVGGRVSVIDMLQMLYDDGFIVKNNDGSFYDSTFRGYVSKLKINGFIDHSRGDADIKVLKKIKNNIRPVDL